VDDAYTAGLLVHPYTFRTENVFLPLDYRSGDDPATTRPGDRTSGSCTWPPVSTRRPLDRLAA
jgi:hypothetical protein